MQVVAIIPARSDLPVSRARQAQIAGLPLSCESGSARARHGESTDDGRIANVCRQHGVEFVMTSSPHATGTDRLAEVAQTHSADIS